MITSVERDHIEAMINRAKVRLLEARDLVALHQQQETGERLEWALDFIDAALVKLSKEET